MWGGLRESLKESKNEGRDRYRVTGGEGLTNVVSITALGKGVLFMFLQ
jgi:hypothetical protein